MCDGAYCPHWTTPLTTNTPLVWSGTTSYTLTNTETTWGTWNVTYSNATTASISLRDTQRDATWSGWIASAYVQPRLVQRGEWVNSVDPVDPQAIAERHELRRATLLRQQVANERAENLLLSCLTEEQKAEYDELDQFRVTAASGRVYVITEGYAGNVVSESYRYCIHGPANLPHADQMLMQKLLIETDEEEFLRVANASVNHEPLPVFGLAA